jgi:hypothetical protein
MSRWREHFCVSGTKIAFLGCTKQNVVFFCSAWPYVQPCYAMAAHLPCLPGSSPNFLRSACPQPGCQLSSFSGLYPMDEIPADYWLILCKIRLLTLPSAAAPSGGRFPAVSVIFLFLSLIASSRLMSAAIFMTAQISREGFLCHYAACGCPPGLLISLSIFVPS